MSPVYGDDDIWLQRRIEMREERRRPARPARRPIPAGVVAAAAFLLLTIGYALFWSL